MSDRICFFIGHRDTPEALRPLLNRSVERLIVEQAVKNFVVGYHGSFDRLAAQAVRTAKTRHDVTLIQLLAYHPSERPQPLPAGFDESLYLSGLELVPKKLAILRANQMMIDRCDFLIAYAWEPAGNALKFLRYAERRAKKDGAPQIENLACSPNST